MGALKIIERNNTRVLTSAQLAEAFGTDLKRIGYNYNYNKVRYVEGKHFFVLTGDERKQFVNETEIHASSKNAHTLYLWTEKGVFLHAKSLGTDKAWNAYSDLVDDYFSKVEQIQKAQIPTTIPTTIEDILLLAIGSMKDMKAEISHLSLIVDNEVHLNDHQLAEIQEAVKKRVGELAKEGFDKHFQSIFSALKAFFSVPKYNKIKRVDFQRAIDFIKGWYPKKSE